MLKLISDLFVLFYYLQGEIEVLIQNQSLLPCQTCGRTFLPLPLKKHEKICLKNSQKKRRPFNSLKQRVEGTDLAAFHINEVLKPTPFPSQQEIKKVNQSKWKEKHLELVNTIRAARGCNVTMASPKKSSSTVMAGNERCPSCDRQFGPKAFDRHVEWCKEHKARIQKSPAANQLAKERLEARTKYRVPPLNKSKRSLTREKYSSPNFMTEKEPVTPTESMKSFSSVNLSRSPSIRKPNSLAISRKRSEKVKVEPSKEKLKLDIPSPLNTSSPSSKVAPLRSEDTNAMGDCLMDKLLSDNILTRTKKCDSAPPGCTVVRCTRARENLSDFSSASTVSPRLIEILSDVFSRNQVENVVLSVQHCKQLIKLDKRKLDRILLEPKKKLLSSRLTKSNNNNNDVVVNVVKTNLSGCYMKYGNLVEERQYDPFESAQRQFMELLEGDNNLMTPYKSTFTTPESYKPSKSPNLKRTSVIDPPCNFQDSMESVNDEFELLENLINDHFKDESTTMSNSFFLHDQKNNNKLDNDIMSLSAILSTRKYSDDMSSIDPSLINENDNLSIPDHFKVDDLSPTSTIDTDITIRNEEINNEKHKETNNNKMTKSTTKTEKPVIKRSVSLINRSESIRKKVKDKATSASTIRSTSKPLSTKSKLTSQSNSSVNFGKGDSAEKKKGLPLLKKSMSLFDPSPKPSMKNRQDVDNYFSGKEQKINSFQGNVEKEELLKPEDLFAVDDKMFEEYKKYEEMYLREKEHLNKNHKKQKPKIENYGILTASEDEQLSPQIGKISNDSAYGSLQRRTSKSRSRGPKLAPLEQNHVDSTSSSGSENCPNSPAVISSDNGKQKLPKFCHECGNKYPLASAKFCIECGVRRLVL